MSKIAAASIRTLTVLGLGLALVISAREARAQFPELTPTGTYVQPDPMGGFTVPADRPKNG